MVADWVPLVSTPLGAGLGAFATYTLGRSRLALTIDRILVQPSRFANSAPVTVDGKLMQKISDAPGMPARFTDPVSSPERTYVTFLEMASRVLARNVQTSSAVEARAEELRKLADSSDWARLIETYKYHQLDFWSLAELVTARGGTVFHTPDPDDVDSSDDTQVYPWVEDGGDEDMMVDLPGTKALGFPYRSANPARQTRARALARRTSRAFAYLRKSDLVAYFTAIRDHAQQASVSERALREEVLSELSHFNRLQVEFMLSNVGRSGVSIAADAAASVNLAGYVHTPKGGVTTTVTSDALIDLRVRRADAITTAEEAALLAKETSLGSDESVPVLLAAGETLRLVATSKDLIASQMDGEALTRAYGSAERHLRLVLGRFAPNSRLKPNGEALTRFDSGAVLFRDLRFGNIM